ncbi:hypothetical protein AVEN_254147-1 [Araneus ventricosus]|uniref:Uncharacterized protein n=1 Tax=Araneus ventricosus TaxID=182803 RepID=A0A4Y2H6W9_ARAVE|nr:hypothetical protein AVEN_254147-1 [Araneus ventricosus]
MEDVACSPRQGLMESRINTNSFLTTYQKGAVGYELISEFQKLNTTYYFKVLICVEKFLQKFQSLNLITGNPFGTRLVDFSSTRLLDYERKLVTKMT